MLAVSALLSPRNGIGESLEVDPNKSFLWNSRRVSPYHMEELGRMELPGLAKQVTVETSKYLLHITNFSFVENRLNRMCQIKPVYVINV